MQVRVGDTAASRNQQQAIVSAGRERRILLRWAESSRRSRWDSLQAACDGEEQVFARCFEREVKSSLLHDPGRSADDEEYAAGALVLS